MRTFNYFSRWYAKRFHWPQKGLHIASITGVGATTEQNTICTYRTKGCQRKFICKVPKYRPNWIPNDNKREPKMDWPMIILYMGDDSFLPYWSDVVHKTAVFHGRKVSNPARNTMKIRCRCWRTANNCRGTWMTAPVRWIVVGNILFNSRYGWWGRSR